MNSTPNDSQLEASIVDLHLNPNTNSKVPKSDLDGNTPASFLPLRGAWVKPPQITPEVNTSSQVPPLATQEYNQASNGIPPPALKDDGQLRFPWAAKMNPKLRNLHRATSPTYLEDGTPMIDIPNHVLLHGLENQKEYVIGQFFRCKTPSGGLVHAVANRIWGKNCKIFTRKLGESSYLFHIPDASTRAWVIQRGLWHVDECILFVAPWTPEASLAMPEISSIPVWVTLENIPNRLYSHKGISWIGSGLGEPVLTEKPRLDPTLMGKAKILVEVELDKNFPPIITVRDKKGYISVVDVEYSWIPSKCVRCGQLGHKESRCLLELEFKSATTSQDVAQATVKTVLDTPIPSSEVVSTTPKVNDFLELVTTPSTPTQVAASADAVFISNSPIATSNGDQTAHQSIPIESINNVSIPSGFDGSTPPPHSVVKTVQESAFASNQVATNAFGTDLSDDERDDYQRTRGGRAIKLTQKAQEMQWTLVNGRGKGRRGRGRGPNI